MCQLALAHACVNHRMTACAPRHKDNIFTLKHCATLSVGLINSVMQRLCSWLTKWCSRSSDLLTDLKLWQTYMEKLHSSPLSHWNSSWKNNKFLKKKEKKKLISCSSLKWHNATFTFLKKAKKKHPITMNCKTSRGTHSLTHKTHYNSCKEWKLMQMFASKTRNKDINNESAQTNTHTHKLQGKVIICKGGDMKKKNNIWRMRWADGSPPQVRLCT